MCCYLNNLTNWKKLNINDNKINNNFKIPTAVNNGFLNNLSKFLGKISHKMYKRKMHMLSVIIVEVNVVSKVERNNQSFSLS